MSTPATGSDVAYTPDSNSEKYGTNRQRELYDELRKLVKKTEAGYQVSQALEMIIPKLVETYPEGRQRLKKKLLAALKDAQNGQADLQKDLDDQKKAKETLDEELRAASVAVNQAKKREAALQGEINDERNKTKRQMEELNRKFNDETAGETIRDRSHRGFQGSRATGNGTPAEAHKRSKRGAELG